MKTFINIVLIIVLFILVFMAGFNAGIHHAITDGEIYTDNQYIYIEIDNNLYVHNK